MRRFLQSPPGSFFLFGPRGTGKSTWLAQVFPEALRLDLLAPDVLRAYQARPERLAELIAAAGKTAHTVVIDEIWQTVKDKLKSLLRGDGSSSWDVENPLSPLKLPTTKPMVILVAVVNGAGKTTSIAKLAKFLMSTNKSVVLAAGDTFRAAAVEQLTLWSKRLGCDIVTKPSGTDPASVAFAGCEHALNTGKDIVIVDTAGRLQTSQNLMQELTKIHRVIGKKIEGAPHESLLVLDATTGQNGLSQAKNFSEATLCTGLVLAKLDGTAKGGVAVAIRMQMGIPVKYIGVGEGIDDLQVFNPDSYVDALFA